VAAATSAGETSAAAIFRRAALLALFAALLLAGPASAQSLDEVASQLQSEHVYGEGTDALKAKIGDAPTFVAVIPASAVQGSAGRTLIALRQAVGVRGSYALLAGSEFRTLSDEFGDAAQVGDVLRAKYGTDTEAMLTAFVDRAAKERERSGGIGGAGILVLLVLIAAVVGSVALITSRRRARARNDGRSTVGEIDVMDDFERLGDQIRALEFDVTLGDAGRHDYDRAVDAYTRANELQRRGDEAGANRALDEGLAAIATARERIAGR
jgi:hypothetical protein